MKFLANEYYKVQGEPFRVEDYRGAKLEMYYLDDRKDYGKFAQRGRFSVWTSNGTDYRLFVDKGYYNAVGDLYRNDINDIWLDYTNNIYSTHKKMQSKFMFISIGILLAVFAGMSLIQALFKEAGQTPFLIGMVVMVIGLMVPSQIQQKQLKQFVAKENAAASNLIKQALGEENFKNIMGNQEAYYQSYFQPSTDEEVEGETETLEESEEESNEEVKDNE